MDVTDMVDYNIDLLNHHDLTRAFFHLDRGDPTVGFYFDASVIFGHAYPSDYLAGGEKSVSSTVQKSNDSKNLLLRLRLGSHLAQHIRHQLEEQKGYSSTVGISTNKLISKLVGNQNKPKGQTVLMPPYRPINETEGNITRFIDNHDIGKIPGIGFKTAQKIRDQVLGRSANFNAGLVYGGTKENVKVRDVRTLSGMPELLGRMFDAPGTPRDLGEKVWGLINGVDNAEVAKAKEVPRQISIVRLHSLETLPDADASPRKTVI